MDAYLVSGGIIVGKDQKTAEDFFNELNNKVDDDNELDKLESQLISINKEIDNITAAIAKERLTNRANAKGRSPPPPMTTNWWSGRPSKSANANRRSLTPPGTPPPRAKRPGIPMTNIGSPQPMTNNGISFGPGTPKSRANANRRSPPKRKRN